MPEQNLEIITPAGYSLSATLFEPEEKPKAAALLASGTGIPRRFYRHFARWLNDHDLAVLTLDNRGIGDSRGDPLPQNEATLWDWANYDLPSAWKELGEKYPDLPLVHIGHSMGGILSGVLPPDRLSGILMVGSGASSWYHSNFPINLLSLILWRVFLPLTIALKGYFPSGWFGLGKPLPKGVARGWARLCLDRPFLKKILGSEIDTNYYQDITSPVVNLAMDDDYLVNPRNQAHLLKCFPKAQTQARMVFRKDRQPVGHLGFFDPPKGKPYWPEALDVVIELINTPIPSTSYPKT